MGWFIVLEVLGRRSVFSICIDRSVGGRGPGGIQDFGKGGRVQVTVKYYNVALSRVTFFSLFMKFRGGGGPDPQDPSPWIRPWGVWAHCRGGSRGVLGVGTSSHTLY